MEYLQENEALTGGEEQNRDISADLIRGHINTIILRCLYDGDKYGYDIINEIEKKSGGLYILKQPTLYSALKRLESLKYVESYYGDYSNGGRRKYFSLTDSGRAVTEKNLSEWEYSRTIIDSLISDGSAHYDFSFITDKQAELVELKRALSAREEALAEEKTALSALKNELQRERALLSTQSASILSQKNDVSDLKEKIASQAKELEEKETALHEKETELLAKEYELVQKSQEVQESKTQLESLQAKILLLEENVVTLKAQNQEKNTDFYNKDLELRAMQAQIDTQKEKLEIETRALLENQAELANRETLLNEQAESEKASTFALLDSERQALDKKEYELSQREFALEEKLRVLENSECKENEKLKDELANIEQQKRELALRQEAYNQQQLDFITRKNTLSAEQFDLADKLTAYNAQLQAFNENSAKLQTEKQSLEQREKDLEIKQSAFEEEKTAFARTKEEAERVLQETQQKASEDALFISRQAQELHEKELSLVQRENALNATLRDMQSKQYNGYYQQSIYPPISPYENRGEMNFNDLHQRAQAEGIRLQTAGTISQSTAPIQTAQPQTAEKGTFNMGLTLFKTAFIIFCIMAFESLAIFFLKDYLSTNVIYPLTVFTVGFIQFAVCAILYACGYRPRAKKKKNAPYVLTAFVIFVIAVILTTMVAVYYKAQLAIPAQLLAFVLIPVGVLVNILFFAGLFYLFSTKTNEK